MATADREPDPASDPTPTVRTGDETGDGTAEGTTVEVEDPPASGTTRRDLVVLVGVTLAFRLPTFFAPTHLTFDDGVFGASAVAMRNGGVPFRDVFSSQGPLFLPLVWIADTLGLHTVNGPRLLGLASGVGFVVALYLAGRLIAGREGGLIAGALGAFTGSSLAVTGSIAADGTAIALATTAFLLALRYREAPSTGRAVATGAVLGAALMVKAIVLPLALPIGLVLLWGRRPKHWVAAVGASVAVGLGLSLLWGFADVWDQSVTYHLEAPGTASPGRNANKILSTYTSRDLLLCVGFVVAAVAAVLGRRRPADDDRAAVPIPVPVLLWTWLGAVVVLLVMENPMWRPHVSSLVPASALLIAWYRPPWKPLLAVGAVATVAMVLTYAGPTLLWAGDYEGDEAVVVDALRALPEGALAISDEPGQVWRAGGRTPDRLVDASSLLTDSGRLTGEDLVEEATAPEVCAFVTWSERFAQFEDVPAGLEAAGYELVERFDEERAYWVRPDCNP